MKEFLAIVNRLNALERRVAGMIKHGRVAEVNAEEGWVRFDLGQGDNGPLLSPKVPYAQFAGSLKTHTPPSVGQQMTFVAPGGDSQQAVAVPLTWSDQNESPSQSADENVITYGDVRITLNAGAVRVEIGGLTFELTGSAMTLDVGGFALRASAAGLAMAGGGVGHNGQDIGSTHRHPDVMPGPANTGTPIANGPTP